MGKHIEVIARGICIEGGKLLVCVNVAGGYGYLPGGHVEFGESASAALGREMQEECNERVSVLSPLLAHEMVFDQGGRHRHELSIVFPVKRIDPTRVVLSREPDIAFEWWPIEGLAARPFRPTELLEPLLRLVACGNPTASLGWLSTVIG